MPKDPGPGDQVPLVYKEIVAPHVESFDHFLNAGLQTVVEYVEPVEIRHTTDGGAYSLWLESPAVTWPVRDDVLLSRDDRLLPRYCREAGTTYKAPFQVDVCYQKQGGPVGRFSKRLGSLPIMVRSTKCHLRHMGRAELARHGEEDNEAGGYFVCNGIERVIRLLIAQRRHYIMALRRPAYRKRGSNYTDAATLIRCVRPDEFSATVRCHYLSDGGVNFAFTLRRAEFFIPAGLLLKCFVEVSDKELYDQLLSGAAPGSSHASFVADRAELLLQRPAALGLRTRVQCLKYLGSHFRGVLGIGQHVGDVQAGLQLLQRHVFIHLTAMPHKLLLLLSMLHKLYALVDGVCCVDNPDALTHHEVLLPGHLLQRILSEKLSDCLQAVSDQVAKDLARVPEEVDLQNEDYVRGVCTRMPDIGRKFEYMLNTGNLVSRSGLDLQQASGFTVVAEKLNFLRYLSHFRSVHRGAFFAQMRTTTVRKLLPEGWGFMCPVHTPDGSPCGLLNHLAAACRVVTAPPQELEDTTQAILNVLAELGMVPSVPLLTPPPVPSYITVMLDGCVVGYVALQRVQPMVDRLRLIKAAVLVAHEGGESACETSPRVASALPELSVSELLVPRHVEVCVVTPERGGPQPGVFLFTHASRLVRPVRQRRSGALELVGTLEQSALHIACPDGGLGGSLGLGFSHEELGAGAMLSVVASATPYSDFNQSPRNMYQCQMGKQTMGTPVHALPHRTDVKLYRLQTPQAPLARTRLHDRYLLDEYPNGTNAVVAVLAYTGYDMEDAMILNRSSAQRGLAHGSLYKTEVLDLRKEKGPRQEFAAEKGRADTSRPVGAFGATLPQNVAVLPGSVAAQRCGALAVDTPSQKDSDRIDCQGLPRVGAVVWPGQSYACTQESVSRRVHRHKLKGEETALVDQVTIIGAGREQEVRRANVRLRFGRNPVIGDKFSSRHGQKGVLSMLWHDVDMPWCSNTGMRPDIIINPHAFPSRMTIGMLVESLSAKAGALTGRFVDATPFQKCDGRDDAVVDPLNTFGKTLEERGFAYRGQETMVSGVTGEEMLCDIFVGIVYYQRLRHMVSDKFQVRSTGPINPLTRQPIKGRKFMGGIRFGEMERDSLLGHGAAYLLHDRLHACSDYAVLDVCSHCGSVLAPLSARAPLVGVAPAFVMGMDGSRSAVGAPQVACHVCDGVGCRVERVAAPYVFKYLVTELAGMNIRVAVELK